MVNYLPDCSEKKRLTGKVVGDILPNKIAAFDNLLQQVSDRGLQRVDSVRECLIIAYRCEDVLHPLNKACRFAIRFMDTFNTLALRDVCPDT